MKLNIKTKLAGFAVVLAFLAPSLTFAQETKTYTVKPGDTLSEIAETYNTTVEKLAKLNNIKNVDLIFIDQVLIIDGAAPVAETTTTEAPVAEVEETPAVAETVVEETTYEATYEAPAPAATESYSAPAATVSGSEAEAKEWIAQKESGGSYTATNGRYIGRYQLTDSYLNGDYSAENQERVADAYVAGRYGSWTAAKNFWLNNGWY
ncbi:MULTISPECIES: LysM peptidoglycan-binding domain-containing protein [unclassified Streptococcus]|uniref:aggregation-promoting factor n=1 Tax=Streptococcus TaxID=1301 RepID=UPI0015BD5C92|nr:MULTISPECIES: LysM peptidoglycan-binding domain-containing protein [unclassified Streptococcus]MCP9016047.1 LysM peptidoglycan-binding domain-containing protein [Streptococcus sp. CF8_St5-17]QLF56276.1 LysM peptidoglycan-binding domain-containing protein [Streptococcus sp. oral taxon 061]